MFRFVRPGIHFELGHLVAQLVEGLRYKPIPDGVIGIIHWRNPSGRTMPMGSTQPQTEMSTRIISWGNKVGRCIGQTTLQPSCADFHEFWDPQRPGTLGASSGLYRDCFNFLFYTFEVPWSKAVEMHESKSYPFETPSCRKSFKNQYLY